MWNKKYNLIFIILLFLAVRLFFLFTGFEKTFYGDELLEGAIAKLILEGRNAPILDYQMSPYSGGALVMGILTIPFFYVFGEYLISVKLVALTFSLGTLVLWYFFLKNYVSYLSAVFVSLLFIFSPPSFIKSNLLVPPTQHYSSTLFTILALIFFFRIIYDKNVRTINYVLFGTISGFAMWFMFTYASTLFTCLLFWLIYDRTFFFKRHFWLFVLSFFVGGGIGIYHNITQSFQGIKNYQVFGSLFPHIPFVNKVKKLIFHDLPYSFSFSDYYIFNGVTLNYLYYFVFIAFLITLIWLRRKLLLKVIISFMPGIKDKTEGKLPSIELFILIYMVIFAIFFYLCRVPTPYKSKDFFVYRFLIPLYPFIFAAIAIVLDNLWNMRKKVFKILTYTSLIFYLGIHSVGLDAETSLKDFGKGIKYKGYSYINLPALFILKLPASTNETEIINRLNLFSNEEIFKNSFSKQITLFLMMYSKFFKQGWDLHSVESLIPKVDERFHHNCYEGLGEGIAYKSSYNKVSVMLDRYKLMDKRYKKYLYYGVSCSLPIQETVDKHTFITSQIDSQFQPYFYRGLGIQLAERMGLTDIDGILLQIDEVNRKYCYIGIGQYFAGKFIWAFADKKYYFGFDGLNKNYWHDCYYGFGWGIGDFFEFDIDRYLAIINNNVSPEYKGYCLEGLADRLRWKFGNDETKLQKMLRLIPLDYFVLDDNTIRFYDKSHRKYLVKGWSFTEEWGTWSEGEESVILVNFTPTLPSPSPSPSPSPYPSPQWGEDEGEGKDIGGGKDYTMLIKATGFSVPGKQQSVRIYLDDNLLGEHTFIHPTTYFEDFEIKIPSAYIKEGNRRISFVYSFTGSPAEYGMGPDIRQLAMGVSSIEFR